MPRQLNVRSDEAHALAHRIAARRGVTASRVVVDALRAYAGEGEGAPDAVAGLVGTRSRRVTDTEVAERRARLETILRDMWDGPPPGASPSADDDMYDENGLPK